MQDIISRNIAPDLGYRVVFVSATQTTQNIGAKQHQLAGNALAIFGNGIIAGLLLATQLKGSGVLSFEFDGDGPFNNFRCDATPLGYVRAMIPDETKERLMLASAETPLIGKGNLYIGKKIVEAKAPFSSILEMQSDNFATNVAHYLKNSEQINGMVGIHTQVENDSVLKCCGFLIEELPNVTEDQRAEMEAQVKQVKDFSEFFDNKNTIEQTIKSILPNVKIQNMKDFQVKFYCPCTGKRFLDSLVGLNKEQLNDLADDNVINTSCDFCKTLYKFDLETILQAKREA